jgi:putative ABC transport system permease protein
VRAEHRDREIALRHALGAHPRQVIRLFFIEALALTVAAAMLGLLLAEGLVAVTIALVPIDLPRAEEVGLDGTAAAFAGGLAALMALVYAAVPARRHARPLAASLTAGGLWATGDRAPGWRGDPLIVLQVILALTLMAGSALMLKTYRNLSRSELGFSPDDVLTMEVGLPSRKARQHARIYQDLVEHIRRLPGVASASAASFVPLTGGEHLFPVDPASPPIPFKFFVPGYFQTMDTPIVEGADLGEGQRVAAPYPVLVSRALARRLYPGGPAVGKPVRRLNEDGTIVEMLRPVPPFTIAGVVGDVRETTLRDAPAEIVYIPVVEPHVEQQIVPTTMHLVLRTHIPPSRLAAAAREAIAALDPTLSVGEVRSLESVVRAAKSRETFAGALLGLAAAVSLFLGAVGVYGSVAHAARRRTREIGIRIALGARRGEVVRMVVAGSMRAVLLGAALGLSVALAATRSLRSLLFGVEPADPVVFLAVTGLLLSAAIAAALLAASRAARVDPLLALRSE